MYCMKCGKETQENQVFCERCLQVMDAYPVKSDAPIQLPNRCQQPAARKPVNRKRNLPPEEQIVLLRKANRRLALIGLILALLLGLSIGVLVYQMTRPEETTTPTTNRNYTYSPESSDAP